MKRVIILIIVSLFLISFTAANGAITGDAITMTTSAIDNSSGQNQLQTSAQNQGADTSLKNQIKAKLTDEQIQKIVTVRNRIRAMIQSGECPEKCTCSGSVTKCRLANGTREMVIAAGKSGNVIVQVKGVNASTKVALYKGDDEKLYGVFKNETKRIRLLPDQVKERIRERIRRQVENENISLDEDGNYQYQAEKRARLFFIFPVRVAVQAELDSETGEVVRLRNSWWAFLAKDEGEEIIGASCGTVTPGMNDECCQNKDFDFWNSETEECEFSE